MTTEERPSRIGAGRSLISGEATAEPVAVQGDRSTWWTRLSRREFHQQ